MAKYTTLEIRLQQLGIKKLSVLENTNLRHPELIANFIERKVQRLQK